MHMRKTMYIKPAKELQLTTKKKATKNPDDRRLVLIRMADGSRRYVTATTFRKTVAEVCEEALAPLKEKITNAAEVLEKVAPVKAKVGNRGRMARRMVTYGERHV